MHKRVIVIHWIRDGWYGNVVVEREHADETIRRLKREGHLITCVEEVIGDVGVYP